MTVPHNTDNQWRKSTRSQDQGACVEVHPGGAVRDSKNPHGPVLAVDLAPLLTAVMSGRIDR